MDNNIYGQVVDPKQFYSGPKGENYVIRDFFANSEEMLDDLKLQENSPNPLGSIVMISYDGNAATQNYETNKIIDNSKNFKNLNGTLWKKEKLTDQELEEYQKNKIIIAYKFSNNNWCYVFQVSLMGETGKPMTIKGTFNVDTNSTVNGIVNWWTQKSFEGAPNVSSITDSDFLIAFKAFYGIDKIKILEENETVIGNFYLYKNEIEPTAEKIYVSIFFIRNSIALPADNDLTDCFYLSKLSGMYTPPGEVSSIQGFYYDKVQNVLKIGQSADNFYTSLNNQILIGNNLDLTGAQEGAVGIGQYNAPVTSGSLFLVANGKDASNKQNLFEIYQPQSNLESYCIKLGDTEIHNQLIDLTDFINLVQKIAEVPSVKHFLTNDYQDTSKNTWILNYNGIWKNASIEYPAVVVEELKIYCAYSKGYSNESTISPTEIALTNTLTSQSYGTSSITHPPKEDEPWYIFSNVEAGAKYRLHLKYSNNVTIDKIIEIPSNNYKVYEEVGIMNEFRIQEEEINKETKIVRNNWDFIISIIKSNFPKMYTAADGKGATNSNKISLDGKRLCDIWRVGDYTKFFDNNYAVIIDTNHDIECIQEDINLEAIDLPSDNEGKNYSNSPVISEAKETEIINNNPKKATYTFMIIKPLFLSDGVTLKSGTAPYYSGSSDFSSNSWKDKNYSDVLTSIRTKKCINYSELSNDFVKALTPVYKKTQTRALNRSNEECSVHKIFLLSPAEIFGTNNNNSQKINSYQYKIFENNNFNLLSGQQYQQSYGSECRDILRSPAPAEGFWMCLDKANKGEGELTAKAFQKIDSSYSSNKTYRRPLFCI